MKSRPSDHAYERALAALTREAAELSVPDLDWDRIEAKVLAADAVSTSADEPLARAARTSGLRKTFSPPTWASTPWPMAIAAAAAAVLIYGGPSNSHAPLRSGGARTSMAQPASPAANLSSLAVGEVAETDSRAAVYDRPGVVSFALAPNSRIEVVANDIEKERTGGITVALSRGSIHADVHPRTEGEVFAIEVEQTRIAVHGTSFSVTREGDHVLVDVTHGSVAVGPVGHRGATHGWLVVGPDRAAFSLDGGRRATWLPPAESAIAANEPAVEAPSAAFGQASASPAKRPSAMVTALSAPRAEVAGSSKSEMHAAAGTHKGAAWGEGSNVIGRDASEHDEASEISAVLRQLEACYEKQASAFGVRFSVESSLKLTILPNGSIREGVFTPPLSPTLMSCADKALGAAHFPGGDALRSIEIPVQLSRPLR